MNNLSDNQQEYLNEQLQQGESFIELIRTKGWQFVQAYYQAKVQELATFILTSDEPIETFEQKRWEIVGIKKLLGYVDSTLKEFEKQNDKS
jgi:hypothetical protein